MLCDMGSERYNNISQSPNCPTIWNFLQKIPNRKLFFFFFFFETSHETQLKSSRALETQPQQGIHRIHTFFFHRQSPETNQEFNTKYKNRRKGYRRREENSTCTSEVNPRKEQNPNFSEEPIHVSGELGFWEQRSREFFFCRCFWRKRRILWGIQEIISTESFTRTIRYFYPSLARSLASKWKRQTTRQMTVFLFIFIFYVFTAVRLGPGG